MMILTVCLFRHSAPCKSEILSAPVSLDALFPFSFSTSLDGLAFTLPIPFNLPW